MLRGFFISHMFVNQIIILGFTYDKPRQENNNIGFNYSSTMMNIPPLVQNSSNRSAYQQQQQQSHGDSLNQVCFNIWFIMQSKKLSLGDKIDKLALYIF